MIDKKESQEEVKEVKNWKEEEKEEDPSQFLIMFQNAEGE